MALSRCPHIVSIVLLVVYTSSCFETNKITDNVEDNYGGLSDREVMLTLVRRIGELEEWKAGQQRETSYLRSRLQQQNRKIDRLQLVVKSQHVDLPSSLTSKQESIGLSKNDDFDSHTGLDKLQENNFRKGLNPRQKRSNNTIVQRSGHLVSEKFNDRRHTRRQVEETNKIAFFATATGQLSNLGASQILEFDNVTTNIGHAYSPHTGAFTAPVDGLYVFSVSLMGQAHRETHYFVSMNGAEISRLYIHGTESPYTTTSHTVVIQLQQGDDVEIRNSDAGEGIYGSRYSCFSGFLLYFNEPSNNQIIG